MFRFKKKRGKKAGFSGIVDNGIYLLIAKDKPRKAKLWARVRLEQENKTSQSNNIWSVQYLHEDEPSCYIREIELVKWVEESEVESTSRIVSDMRRL